MEIWHLFSHSCGIKYGVIFWRIFIRFISVQEQFVVTMSVTIKVLFITCALYSSEVILRLGVSNRLNNSHYSLKHPENVILCYIFMIWHVHVWLQHVQKWAWLFSNKLLFEFWKKVTLSIIAFISGPFICSSVRLQMTCVVLFLCFLSLFWRLKSVPRKLHEWMNNDRISIWGKDCFKMIFCTWFYLISFVSCSEML